MGSENLAYALTQVVHNFGAACVLGGAVFALWPVPRLESARAFARLICLAWGAQIASGIVFGLTSFHYYGATPDLSSVALAALAIKVTAAISGSCWPPVICSTAGTGTASASGTPSRVWLRWPPSP
jgi:hypothetical protein